MREKCVVVGKARRLEPSKLFDIKHKTIEFGVCPAGFLFLFGPACAHYVPISPSWNGVFILCHCMLKVYNLLLKLILKVVTFKRLPWNSGENLDFVLLNYVETVQDYRNS